MGVLQNPYFEAWSTHAHVKTYHKHTKANQLSTHIEATALWKAKGLQ